MGYALAECLVYGWSLFWLYILFTQGYARIQYPGAERGVNPFSNEQLARVRKKGWIWTLISAAAIAAGFIVPGLLSPLF